MGAFTELDAINHVLEAAGDPPVSSLTDSNASSVAIINRKLRAERLKMLSRGHSFNTSYPYLTPDSSGYIAIGDEMLSVDGFGVNADTAYTVKNGKLFDITNQTDEFTDQIQLKVIYDVDFEDMRTQTQYQLMAAVARSYQRQYQQDMVYDAELVEDEREAEVASAEEELRNSNYNPKDDTPLGRVLKGGLFGYD